MRRSRRETAVMHSRSIAAFAAVLLALASPPPAPAQTMSATPKAAMPACPASDPVVWINTSTKVYHMQGDKYFGNTKSGKYACESAAKAAGAHAAGTPKAAASAAPGSMPAMPGMAGTASPSPKPKHHHTPAPSPAPTS
jgi:hypothetical protein